MTPRADRAGAGLMSLVSGLRGRVLISLGGLLINLDSLRGVWRFGILG